MKQYKYTSDEPAGIFQLDSVLRQMGERSRQSGAKWECDVTKNDDGTIDMSISITPAPPLPDLSDKPGKPATVADKPAASVASNKPPDKSTG